MKPIDTHAHLDDAQFKYDFDEVLQKITNELEFCVNIGYDLKSSQESIEFAKNYHNIYATIGVHPDNIAELSDKTYEKLFELSKNKKVVAIGEIGLDYHWMTMPKDIQQSGFKKLLKLAEDTNLPVVIHSRDAQEDTLKILNEFSNITGIIHCYPWNLSIAQKIIDKFYIGVGGVVTFKNATKLTETVKNIPLEKIVLETDCPYMTPVPFRGKRNEPIFVKYIAEKIAELKKIPLEEVIQQTTINAKTIYKIEEKS